MRIHLTCIALMLTGCVASAEAHKRRHRAHADAGAAGGAGAVCRLGEERESMRRPGPRAVKVEDCGPGLQCGYPCGIPGCNWVCMTPAEAQHPRP
jgi:hypothetical protein